MKLPRLKKEEPRKNTDDDDIVGETTLIKTQRTHVYDDVKIKGYCCRRMKEELTRPPTSTYSSYSNRGLYSSTDGHIHLHNSNNIIDYCPFCGKRIWKREERTSDTCMVD